ncbi:MAG: hypothetical protein H0V26_03465, partial [Solirubrobacterales bacterium]|nr:hypothetical protein [Solirubrobacterales bacterium]
MRVLAVGDSYLSASVMRAGLEHLGGIELEVLQIDEERVLDPRTTSERRIREYVGTPTEIARHLDSVEVLLVHGAPVTEELLTAAQSLRLVGCARGGPVNVDVEAAARLDIPVVGTPGKNAEAVADEAIALMVMVARGFRRALRRAESEVPTGASAFEGADLMGHELGGLVLGLVGHGQVGRRVATRAAAFGMQVLAHDPFSPPGPDDVAEPVGELNELLARSDVVSLHARATPDTENLVRDETLGQMRDGAILINT